MAGILLPVPGGTAIALRRRLPAGVRMYAGDDFNCAELIAGDGDGYSHALAGLGRESWSLSSPGLTRQSSLAFRPSAPSSSGRKPRLPGQARQ